MVGEDARWMRSSCEGEHRKQRERERERLAMASSSAAAGASSSSSSSLHQLLRKYLVLSILPFPSISWDSLGIPFAKHSIHYITYICTSSSIGIGNGSAQA